MNIAFSAVLIVLVIYPGILLRVVYVKGVALFMPFGLKSNAEGASNSGLRRYANKNKFRFLRQGVWEQIIASILPAFFIHGLALGLTSWLGREPDPVIIYKVLTSQVLEQPEIKIVTASLPWFTSYFLITLLIPVVVATVLRFVVFQYNLDQRFDLLKFSNEWYYLLSGRVLQRSSNPIPSVDTETEADLILIHALVETKEQSVVYNGFLWEYELTETNDGLDRIVLFEVSRRDMAKLILPLDTDDTAKRELFELTESREIDEDLLILPFTQIKNLTITYVDLRRLTENEQKVIEKEQF